MREGFHERSSDSSGSAQDLLAFNVEIGGVPLAPSGSSGMLSEGSYEVNADASGLPVRRRRLNSHSVPLPAANTSEGRLRSGSFTLGGRGGGGSGQLYDPALAGSGSSYDAWDELTTTATVDAFGVVKNKRRGSNSGLKEEAIIHK